MSTRLFLPLAALLTVACAPAIPARPDLAPVSEAAAGMTAPAIAVSAPVIPRLDLSPINAEVRTIARPR